jgi:hypothetical protein
MKDAFAYVYHPQSNGAVERANALIFEAIKKILKGEKKGKWTAVMPRAVWSHNMAVCRATNITPFWLMFGVEVVLPEEVKHQSLRTAIEALACPSEVEEKDLLEPDRIKAVANLQKYQEETKAWRDSKVKLWEPNVGDLVLLWSPHTENTTEKSRPGAYHLSDPQGRVLEHYWNVDSLCHFFI